MADALILGAGPAGLAAAACLARRGLGYLLLEQGNEVAAGMRRLCPTTRLVSPTPLSRLPGMEDLEAEEDYMTFGRYVELLERYREQIGIALTFGARVLATERREDGFLVRFEQNGQVNEAAARFVINATGVVSSPVLPADFDPAQATFLFCHSRDLRPDQLATTRRLLVIGGGISADEVIADWLRVRQEGAKAWLSLRSNLRLAPKTLLGVDVHYWVRPAEYLPIFPGIWRKFRTNPILGSCLPAALRAGEVQRVPGIRAYGAEEVELRDGSVLDPELVVFATGFRYATPHLGTLFSWPADERPRARRCESLDAPGLFLLGLHFGRNYASPYLRGIADDAEYVAGIIDRRARL